MGHRPAAHSLTRLPKGKPSLKPLSQLDQVRVWAALTGLLLAMGHIAASWLDLASPPVLPLLISAIGGFELFLFTQDVWLKRGGRIEG